MTLSHLGFYIYRNLFTSRAKFLDVGGDCLPRVPDRLGATISLRETAREIAVQFDPGTPWSVAPAEVDVLHRRHP
jgi:hypothetical protein